jgi:hypothetical protein
MAVMAAGVMVLTLSGCGEPEFLYAQNSDQHVYFKVPSSWHEIHGIDPLDQLDPVDPGSGAARVREQRRLWSIAYDNRTDEVASHFTLFDNEGEPVVYAKVWQLTEEESNKASLDFLRDFVLPVSETGVTAMIEREQQIAQAVQSGQISEQQAMQYSTGLSDYELLADQVLDTGEGIKGVRSIFNYRFAGGPLYTIDQTAYLSTDLQEVYVLVISSSAKQYIDRRPELDAIASSFTVRSAS